MQLDLKKLFESGGERLSFDFELDLRELEQWGEKPFGEPVAIRGTVENRAGVVTLRYSAKGRYCAQCARCLELVQNDLHMEFSHTVVRRLNQDSDDDFVVVEDGLLDLGQLATDDISLELPIRVLCSEDCKGLCPQCGANLNKTTCSCQEPDWTPGSRRPFQDLF